MKKILVAGIVVVAIAAGIGLFAAPVLAGGLFRSGNTQVNATSPCCTTTAPTAGCCPGGIIPAPAVNSNSASCCG